MQEDYSAFFAKKIRDNGSLTTNVKRNSIKTYLATGKEIPEHEISPIKTFYTIWKIRNTLPEEEKLQPSRHTWKRIEYIKENKKNRTETITTLVYSEILKSS